MTRVSKQSGGNYYLLHPERRAKMPLPVPIDEKVTARLNARLAAITSERVHTESKKKAAMEPYNKRLAELRKLEMQLVTELESGTTTVEVEVQERADFEAGEAWMVRLDTGMEVPDTRRQLAHSERQAFAPGRDGEEPRRIHPVRVTDADPDEEDDEDTLEEEDDSADGGDSEAAAAPVEPWKGEVGWGWTLEEVPGKSAPTFMLTDGTVAFGPWEYDEGFHSPGARDGLTEEARGALCVRYGGSAEDANPDAKTTPAWKDSEALLAKAEEVVEALLESRASAAPEGVESPSEVSPAAGKEGAVPKLYLLPDHGWSLYVHEGDAYLRLPNVEQDSPPRFEKDVGPFRWNATDLVLDKHTATPTDEWLAANDKLMREADSLCARGVAPKPLPLDAKTASPSAPTGGPPPGMVVAGVRFFPVEWVKAEDTDLEPSLVKVRFVYADTSHDVSFDPHLGALLVTESQLPIPDAVLTAAEDALNGGSLPLPEKPQALSPGELAASADDTTDFTAEEVEQVASSLSDAARKVVRYMARPGAASDNAGIGNATHVKAGAVLNGLHGKQVAVAANTERTVWHLTALGKAVAGELERRAQAKA